MTGHNGSRDRALNPDEQRFRDWVLREVETTGTVVIDVPPDDQGAGYTFSVGAWRRFGIAEAVVLGLPEGMGNTLIHMYLERAKAGAVPARPRLRELLRRRPGHRRTRRQGPLPGVLRQRVRAVPEG
ncbi:hypothetical protein GCM10029964_031710 [Kibdelosporangium lantanae]